MNFDMKLRLAVNRAFWRVYGNAPKDTWNLANNALKMEETADSFIIWVDPKIAPYMVYTEEKWISPYWRGKHNPNEGWFKSSVEEIVHLLARQLDGKEERK